MSNFLDIDTPEDAATVAESIAIKLGNMNFPDGMVVEVRNEAGDVVASIPVRRLHG